MIKTTLLDQAAFLATQTIPMNNITQTADEIVDLWAYADIVIEELYHSCTAWEWVVRWIYESTDGEYQHIGIPVPLDNTYLVVVVCKPERRILGHHILDLNYLQDRVSGSLK